MDDFFGPNGILKERLPNFEYRAQQQELAEKIDSFLSSGRHILAAEAPTGVGKTFAMLIPAMLRAKANNETVLVLTSGITLQEQLINKDIPTLINTLGLDLPYGLLKGRGNYACIRRAREISQEGFLDFGGDKGRASRDIGDWLYSTETGDLSELPLPDSHPARETIASSHLTCMGGLCPHHEECFYNNLMRRAYRWRVIVANYHVYFSYVLGQRKPFPVPCSLILCDEAHKMEEAARSVTQIGVNLRDWQRLLRRAPKLDKIDKALLRSADCEPSRFAAHIADLSMSAQGMFEHFAAKLPDGSSFKEFPQELREFASDTLAKCDVVIHELNLLSENAESGYDPAGLSDEASGPLAVWNAELSQYRDSLRWCSLVDSYPNWAYWRDGDSVRSSCVAVGEILPDAFNDPSVPVVALSATLTVDGSFDYWSAETGLVPDDTLILDSPFDLEHQMELHVVDLGTKVMDKNYADVVSRVCRKYAIENGGATLILLSSRRLLSVVSAYLKMYADDDNLNILVQGDLPRSELLEEFREADRNVLVGMASFREGIDVPGDALTQVIIDRIPFPHPNDPVGSARAELEGPQNFMKVVLPGAKMQLRQATGRLVRTGTDTGRVVILDGRIVTRSGWTILNSLPKVPLKKIRLIK